MAEATSGETSLSDWSCVSTAAGVSRRLARHSASRRRAREESMCEAPEMRKSERSRGGHHDMSARRTRTVPERGASGTTSAGGHAPSSSTRRATARTYSRYARPSSSEATGTESCARTETPRATRRPARADHAPTGSGATTTTSRMPSLAREATSRATSSGSAEGPAGRSTRRAPVGDTAGAGDRKSDERSAWSSGGRA
ncbi:hypothetical protein B5F79_03615, partial [Olsenella sp. An285]